MTSLERAMSAESRHPSRSLFTCFVLSALLLPHAEAEEPASPKLRKTLGGSNDVGRVRCVAFSPDGKTLVSGSLDGSIRLWDLKTGKGTIVQRTVRDAFAVVAVAFRPDGKTFATACGGVTQMWDARTGKPLARLPGDEERIQSLAFTPDGKTLITAALDVKDCRQVHTLKVWDVDSRKRKAVLGGYEHSIHGVSISPAGRMVASASSDGVRLWDLKTAKEVARIKAVDEDNRFQSVVFSPDGKTLATAGGGADEVVRLWDVKSRKLRFELKGHNNGVFCLAFTPDGKTLISGSFDTHVRLWDVKTGKNTAVLRDHRKEVNCVAVSPDGRTLATGGDDQTIMLWDLAPAK